MSEREPLLHQNSRAWNGFGLSFWSCKCGARRRVESITANPEHIVRVNATPCKRCGDEGEPVGWPSDPWLGFEETQDAA